VKLTGDVLVGSACAAAWLIVTDGEVVSTLTVWAVVPELPLRLEFPAYVAVSVFAPDVVDVREQEYVTVAALPPVAVVSWQLSVPSETVTVPFIVEDPEARVTLTLTVYACTVVYPALYFRSCGEVGYVFDFESVFFG